MTAQAIRLDFVDDGAPFDPLVAAPPDLNADIVERGVGGLGLHLIRELADNCHYARRDGCNILHVEFERTAQS
ncbi:Serine/threonine-protein kinase BtrW [compost metagenome]